MSNLQLEWPLWEVFIRSQHGLAHKHVGSLHAVDGASAVQQRLLRGLGICGQPFSCCPEARAHATRCANRREPRLIYRNIVYTAHQGLARLVLNRPDRLNSFTVAMHLELRHALDVVAKDSQVRALVLTGAGRAFCAGQDLNDPAVAGHPADTADAAGAPRPDLGLTIENDYAPLVRRLRSLPKPVVCAINGVAAGAGANVALACDIVIAAESARFIQPFCKLGLVPDAGGSWFLPELVGRARAMGLSLLGDALDARQAAQWGLIWKCVPDGELEDETYAVAGRLSAGPTLGLTRTRQAIDAAANSTLDQQLDLERDLQRELGYSLDYAEGAQAFRQKRVPKFVGR